MQPPFLLPEGRCIDLFFFLRFQAFGVVDWWLCVAPCFYYWFSQLVVLFPSLVHISSLLSPFCRALCRSKPRDSAIRWRSDLFLYGIVQHALPPPPFFFLEGVDSRAIILSHRIIVPFTNPEPILPVKKYVKPPTIHAAQNRTDLGLRQMILLWLNM